MQNHVTISLHRLRAKQLRQIAQHHKVPASEMLDLFIRDAWCSITDGVELPGLDFNVDLDCDTGEPVVIFTAHGISAIGMTPAQAHEVAHGIRTIATGSAPRFEVIAVQNGWRSSFIGTRQGRGYTIHIRDNLDDESRPPALVSGLTRGLASDLAETFDAYAVKAAALPAKVAA